MIKLGLLALCLAGLAVFGGIALYYKLRHTGPGHMLGFAPLPPQASSPDPPDTDAGFAKGRDIVGSVAHDLNNQLAAIGYGIRLAETAETAEARRGFHRQTRAASELAGHLARGLSIYAAFTPGTRRLHQIADLGQDIEDQVRAILGDRLSVQNAVPSTPHTVLCDQARLREVLAYVVHLLSAGTAGAVGLEIARAQNGAAHHGVGVTLRRLETEPENAPHQAVAQALPILRALAQQMGAELVAETDPKAACAVSLHLPCA